MPKLHTKNFTRSKTNIRPPDSEKLKDVFYSGYPAATAWAVLDELVIAIDQKSISYDMVSIISVGEFHQLEDQVKVSEGLGPQNKGHMALKIAAANWLEKQGKKSIKESYFAGMHPDVMSSDNKIIIECGTTDPQCVPLYLGFAQVKYVGIIPYPFFGEPQLQLYKFTRGPYFDEWQKQKIDFTRTTFLKFHRK